MRNLAELNINEGGRPVSRPPPSDAQISEFERQFGVTVPLPLITLLRYANGGHPERDSIDPVGATDGSGWGVNRFFHLSSDRTGPSSLWKAMQAWHPILGKAAIPIANDGCGNVFFIDSTSDAAEVKVCIHDDNFSVRDLAPSFEDFIDRLYLDPDYI
jgi:hypothetical protein